MDFKFDYNQKIIINGKEYASMDEVPPEMREAMKKAFSENHDIKGLKSALEAFFNNSSFDFKTNASEDLKKIFEVSFSATNETLPGNTPTTKTKDFINVTPLPSAQPLEYDFKKPIEAEPSSHSGRKVAFFVFVALVIIVLTAYMFF